MLSSGFGWEKCNDDLKINDNDINNLCPKNLKKIFLGHILMAGGE